MYYQKYLKYKNKYLALKSNNQKGGLPSQNVERLYKLYLRYYSKIILYYQPYLIQSVHADFEKIVGYGNIQNAPTYKTMFLEINTDYTIDEIEKNFDKYGIIILRDPTKSNKLLLGCGNAPLIDFDKQLHAHKEYITINPEITMNPTIVGSFGFDEGIVKLLNDLNFQYNELYGERVTIVSNKEDAERIATTILDKIMVPNYDVYELANKEYFGKGKEGFFKSNMVYDPTEFDNPDKKEILDIDLSAYPDDS